MSSFQKWVIDLKIQIPLRMLTQKTITCGVTKNVLQWVNQTPVGKSHNSRVLITNIVSHISRTNGITDFSRYLQEVEKQEIVSYKKAEPMPIQEQVHTQVEDSEDQSE